MSPGLEKIPDASLSEGASPHSFSTWLLFSAFNGNVAAGEYWNPYAGVFPLLLAGIGIWKKWSDPWVRYLTGLAAVAFLCSLGASSLLHGLLYALVPFFCFACAAASSTYLFSVALP